MEDVISRKYGAVKTGTKARSLKLEKWNRLKPYNPFKDELQLTWESQ